MNHGKLKVPPHPGYATAVETAYGQDLQLLRLGLSCSVLDYNEFEEPNLLTQQTGAWEINSESSTFFFVNLNKFVQQKVLQSPVNWCSSKAKLPTAIIGSKNWSVHHRLYIVISGRYPPKTFTTRSDHTHTVNRGSLP